MGTGTGKRASENRPCNVVLLCSWTQFPIPAITSRMEASGRHTYCTNTVSGNAKNYAFP